MDKEQLRKFAWREAAALLEADCDSADLPEDQLTEEEEDFVREFIRNEIVNTLRRRGR